VRRRCPRREPARGESRAAARSARVLTCDKTKGSGPSARRASARRGHVHGRATLEQRCSRRQPNSSCAIAQAPNVEVSGGLKRAKQALARPLDRQVRAERNSKPWRGTRGRHAGVRSGHWPFTHAVLAAQPWTARGSSLGLSAPDGGSPSSARKPARLTWRTALRARDAQTRAADHDTWRAARATEATCERALTGIANGP
jgi:hypothetical protein